tara:strand:- start:139 stop:555 length:417 start_codon:yes stop_codon:yes gene_type:complete
MSIEDRVPITIPENETDSETEYHEIDIASSSDEEEIDNDLDDSGDIQGESVYYDSYEQITRVTSKPITIEKSNMFYSNKNDYHLINSTEYKYMSEPPDIEQLNNNNINGSLSNSLKSYLFNSIDFLRHSYYYISRKTI